MQIRVYKAVASAVYAERRHPVPTMFSDMLWKNLNTKYSTREQMGALFVVFGIDEQAEKASRR